MFTFSWNNNRFQGESVIKGPLKGHNGDFPKYKYHPIVLGSIYRKEQGTGINYRDIKTQTQIQDPRNRNLIHRIEIEVRYGVHQVRLNDKIIATAPGKNRVQDERFCKAVVWGLLNDEITLKEKLSEIGFNEGDAIRDLLKTIKIVPGPRSLFGWHSIGSFQMREEAIA